MSGDVQPRKRKDKKKRKEDDPLLASNEDVNIHVHKEGGTGGGICAKIVFFFLFSALIVLIGLIIKENQGLNDLENLDGESPYSRAFEGWVEQHPEDHDELEGEDSHELIQDQEDGHSEEDVNLSYESYDEPSEEEEEDEESVQEKSEEETNERAEESEVLESDEDDNEEVEDVTEESEATDTDKSEESQEINEVSEEKDEESKEEIPEADTTKVDESQETQQDKEREIRTTKEEQTEEQQQTTENPKNIDLTSHSDLESGSDKQSDDEGYEHSNITNKEDYKIKEDIDAAQQVIKKNAAYANKLFEALLKKHPYSPRALYGKGVALDTLADQMRSNDMLQEALVYYSKVLNSPNVPDPLYKMVAERYIERARFLGKYKKVIAVQWQLIKKYPDDPVFMNNLAVTYLTINLVEEARSLLKKVLARWPDNGFALVHYGFILKTTDNKLEESVKYLTTGLKTKAPGVKDGRFYFHLGDALARLGRQEDAMKLYEEGVQEGVFMSKYQRSLYNVPRLKAKPWWDINDLPGYKNLISTLKQNWIKIRNEGQAVLNERGYFKDEAENLRDTGTWKQFELFARGKKIPKNCDKCPITCAIIEMFPEASSCRRGQTKFSVMHPNTHVWSHCGPTNCRLRIHLGLKVPSNTFLRVADETRSWKEGDAIIFDDSFEHEVWHNGSEFRLVLIVDVWHPELSDAEKNTLPAI